MALLIAAAVLALHGTANPATPADWKILDDLSQRAVRFFCENSNPVTGLTKDRSANLKPYDAYDVASIASTGYALSAYTIAEKRGWLDHGEALARVKKTLHTLDTGVEKKNGWFYHFMDWGTGKRVWNCELSSVDSSILFAGMLVAEQGFHDPEVSRLTDKLMAAVDWKWMLTSGGKEPDSLAFCHGWNPEKGFLPYHWSDYSEQSMMYFQAYGAFPQMPRGSWASLRRRIVDYKGRLQISGGELFMHQMSHGYFDFSGKRDKLGFDYWVSSRNMSLTNRQYAIDNPKGRKGYSADIWGFSASDTPTGYGGNNPWGNDDGTVVPTGAIASLPFTPDESLAAVRAFSAQFPAAYGRYGFSNGINPDKNWNDPDAIGIDLGMMLLMIENFRDGLVWKLSMSHPINAKGFAAAGFHATEEGPLTGRALQVKQ